jgi:putative hydrolase of the HAD superfamily
VIAGVERRYGLPAGALLQTAMAWDRLLPAVTGRVGHAGWMAEVAEALAVRTGEPVSARAAVDEWSAYRGEVDPEVLAFVRQVRAAGVPVGLATNATDLLDADLAMLGLTGEVDLVFNSAVLGAHKPTKEYFHRVCVALEMPPNRVLLIDDTDRFVRGARAAGLAAYRWSGPADLLYLRAALGVGVA